MALNPLQDLSCALWELSAGPGRRPAVGGVRRGAALAGPFRALGLLCGLLCWAAPALAQERSQIEAFDRSPTSNAAIVIAVQLRARGNVPGAANWAERALACPNQDSAHRRASALLRELHWPLRDAEAGLVEIQVHPPHALLTVDDVPFLPKRAHYRIWLRSGSHQVLATLAGFATEELIVDAKAGETRSQSIRLRDMRPAVLELDVRPVTGEVWVDGMYQGLSTRRVFQVRAGQRLLEIKADGFMPWTDTWVLAPAERRRVDAQLERAGALRRNRPTASNADRPLSPLELANRGERHELGHRPIDRLRHEGGRPQVSGSAEDAKPRNEDGEGAPALDSPTSPNATPALPSDAPVEVALGADEQVEAPSSPMSSIAKGALWLGTGAAFAAVGAGMVLYGIGEAQAATEAAVQQKAYRARYDAAANLVYAGYGAVGAGAIAAGVSSLYLFGSDGLGRAGRGWLLAGVGTATAAVGAAVMLQAGAAATSADAFSSGDPRYGAIIDGATSAWQAGLAAAVVGGCLAAGGTWLLMVPGQVQEAQATPTLLPMAGGGGAQASGFFGLQLSGRF